MVTYFLAGIIGWYLLIVGVLLLFRKEVVLTAMRDVMRQPGVLQLIGVITLIIGLLLVVSHNYWSMNWTVVVTIIAWITLFSGIIRLFFPEWVHRVWGKIMDKPETCTMSGIILLIIGFFLLFHVYFG